MRCFFGCVLMLSIFFSNAQERIYTEPIKIPLLLSGSFAELRSNHFHSGIDIKTNGQGGLPVYSVAEGFVSRIVVSQTGFGNALYIDHPNGTTSVYGHLLRYRDDIAKYIKEIQYKNQSFNLDIPVTEDKFVIKKDEIVAYSGNSGSSAGPHLHFEIRDSETQEPLNPLKYNFKVKDTTDPKIFMLMIYPLDKSAHVNFSSKKQVFGTELLNGSYHIRNNPVIPVSGQIGFGVQTNDYLDGTTNKCGINSLKLLIDGEEYFSLEINKFNFDETRYINSFIDYEELMKSNRRFIKTWKDPGNKMNIYKNPGKIFNVSEGETHKIEIIVADSYKNSSRLSFTISGKSGNNIPSKQTGKLIFKTDKENTFEEEGIKLDCEEGSFNTDFDFLYDSYKVQDDSGKFSKIHKIHNKYTPIHKPVKLSIKAENLPDEFESKALIAKMDEKTGYLSSGGGTFRNGWISTSIREFGNYVVVIDTIPPAIKSLSIDNNTLKESSRIRFKIYDSLSGIKDFNGTIDDKWVLFEYDAKNSLITYTFDSGRMTFGKKHQLRLVVTDNKDNHSIYEGTFFK